jgi:hypothetical protein
VRHAQQETWVSFWNWRRGTGPVATEGSAAVSLATDLAPIELYTADARIVAWIDPDGHRVTDLLGARDEIRLWRPSPGPLDALDAPAAATDEPVQPSDLGGDWQTLPTEAIILAMPPEWRSSRQLRLHRRLRRAAVTAGPFSVTGNIHLPPGTEAGWHVVTRGRFLPLTDAYILHNGEPPFEHVVSVVIVNTAHIVSIVPLVTLA